MMISTNHYLDLVDGRFARTRPEDLAKLFENLATSQHGKKLVVHFHGGLVNRKSGMKVAENLFPVYSNANTYPVFFLWNSGLLTSLRTNLDEIAQEEVFVRLVRRIVRFVRGKFGEPKGTKGAKLDLESWKKTPRTLIDLEKACETIEPADRALLTEVSKMQEEQFREELKKDRILQDELRAIATGLLTPEEIAAAISSRGTGAVRASKETLMSPHILGEIAREHPKPEEKGISTIATVIRYAAGILKDVVNRYIKEREHGLYTTVVEEVLRTLYIDNAGGLVWKMMKKDTQDAFGADPKLSGGTAFIHLLKENWQPDRRVTLIGHSTGAIYICEFLEHIDPLLPSEAKFDVVFLAPACTFKFLHERLDIFKKRVSNIRSFALKDELERGYWEVPVLYRGSLLYMVSGLFEEDEVDMPLVGMERYYSAEGPYDRAEIKSVRDYLASGGIWSVTDEGAGRRSNAEKHTAFDNDPKTLESIEHLLREGF